MLLLRRNITHSNHKWNKWWPRVNKEWTLLIALFFQWPIKDLTAARGNGNIQCKQ